jgi:predicted DNA-binding antitoxin AbrB/MazE fold protein
MNLTALFENLTKSISPSMGLGLLRVGIEKKLGRKIEGYDMTYIAATERIFFTVGNLKEDYNSTGKDKIIFIIKALCKQKLKDGESIDIVIIHYTLKETKIEIGITTKDGNKEAIEHTL